MNRFAAAALVALTALSTGIGALSAEAKVAGPMPHTAWYEPTATPSPCDYFGSRVKGFLDDGSAVTMCEGAVFGFDPDSNEWNWIPQPQPWVTWDLTLYNAGVPHDQVFPPRNG